MKRNQMLRIIANTLYNNSMRSSMLETLPLAEKVLVEVEKYMLPPDWSEEGREKYEDKYFEDLNGFSGSYTWEPDNGALDPYDPTIWEDKRGNK